MSIFLPTLSLYSIDLNKVLLSAHLLLQSILVVYLQSILIGLVKEAL